MAPKLRFGIMSTGNIARQFAIGLSHTDRCMLQAVGSRSLDSAQAFVGTYGAATAHGSYDALVADPKVDAIYIGLPNSMHREWTIKCLKAGKHVLCEKPMASNLAETQEMFDVARQAGRVLVEAFMYRSHPQTLKLLEVIKAGAIGQVRIIRTSFNYRTTKISDNIRFDASMAGGALMDIGCYCLDFSQLIAGCEPKSVRAHAILHASGVDEAAAGLLEFPNGIMATFTCGMTVPANNTAHVCGSENYIEIPVPWKPAANGSYFVVAQAAKPKMEGGTGGPPPQPQVVKVPAEKDMYAYEADDFAACVFDGVSPRMPERATLSNMRILDDLRRQVGVKFR